MEAQLAVNWGACGGRPAAAEDRQLLDKEIKGGSSISDPPPLLLAAN